MVKENVEEKMKKFIHGIMLEEMEMKEKIKTIFDELFKYHHKRKFSKKIHEELLPIAWHPDRVYDWCFDEEEKGFLEGMWES